MALHKTVPELKKKTMIIGYRRKRTGEMSDNKV